MNPSGTDGSADCLHCGARVSDRFAAVFGDKNGGVHRCPARDSMPRISRRSAAGKDIASHVNPDDESAFNRDGRVGAAPVETDRGDGR